MTSATMRSTVKTARGPLRVNSYLSIKLTRRSRAITCIAVTVRDRLSFSCNVTDRVRPMITSSVVRVNRLQLTIMQCLLTGHGS